MLVAGHRQHPHHGPSYRVHDPNGRGSRQNAPEGLRCGGRCEHGYPCDARELYRHAEVQRHEEHEEGVYWTGHGLIMHIKVV